MRRTFLERTISAFACAVMMALPAAAQVPPDIAAKLRELGRGVEPVKTAEFYKGLHDPAPYAGVNVQRDIKYGPDERNLLDIATPPQAGGGPRPVLVFIHGGGLVRGDRITIAPFYSNVPVWAVKNGFTGVSMTYRLAPKHKWPAGREDIAAAVNFLKANIARHGGDPQRIYLMGHSAGAIHLGHYIAWAGEAGGKSIAGAILLSGLFEFTGKVGPGEQQYFNSPEDFAAGSSIRGLGKAPFPVMVAYGELDPPVFVAHSQMANKVLCAANRCPRFVPLKDHSHISEAYAIGTADTSLTREILGFTGMAK